METVQLCICREHIVMGHSRAARGKTYWCMSEIADLTHLLCGGLWVCCSSHPPFSEFKFNLVCIVSSRSARVTPWDLDSKKNLREQTNNNKNPWWVKEALFKRVCILCSWLDSALECPQLNYEGGEQRLLGCWRRWQSRKVTRSLKWW